MLKFTCVASIIFTLSACASIEEYDDISKFQDNYAKTELNGLYGIIDTSLNVIVPPFLDKIISYEDSPYYFDSWLYGVKNDSIVIFDTSGLILNKYPVNKDRYPFSLSYQGFTVNSVEFRTEDQTYYFAGNNNWGGISYTGDTILPFLYEHITKGLNGDVIATKGKTNALETHLYDLNGNLIRRTYNVPIRAWAEKGAYWVIHKGHRIELRSIELNKFELIEKLDYLNVIVADINCWVKKGEQWHLIDNDLTLSDKGYDDVLMNKNWGVVWKNSKVAIVNSKGELISEFIYSGNRSDFTSNSNFIVAKNRKHIDVLNCFGELILRLRKK